MSGVMRLPAQQESAVYVLAERMDNNDKRYEERFATVNASVDEVKGAVKNLGDKLDGVDTTVTRIESSLIPPPPPSGWHIGTKALSLIGALIVVVSGIVGSLVWEVYLLQPARMEAARSFESNTLSGARR